MATRPRSNPVGTVSYAERHTAGLPESIDATHARALSKTLFARLDSLEEGTVEFSYVRNSLVELNLALVRFAVGTMGVRGETYEDVVQVGTIGLIKAINRFDPGRGVEFPTFA